MKRKPKRRRWRPQILTLSSQIPLFLVIIPCSSLFFFPILSAGHRHYFTNDNRIPILLKMTSHHGNFTPFYAGHDIDGQELFICRTHKFGQIIPGKYSNAIGKCSIAYEHREMQFSQFELLVETTDTRYEWIKLKKPVIDLPDNVLFGGSHFPSPDIDLKIRPRRQNLYLGFLGSTTNRSVSRSEYRRGRRRSRRQTTTENNGKEWSRNWRGIMAPSYHTRRISRTGFKEIPLRCLDSPEKCQNEYRKLNYFIARCSLRTGNMISEQIGKILWNKHEWIASFPFGGHEIYCLDYSVLTLKEATA